jgi:hypothetical protein
MSGDKGKALPIPPPSVGLLRLFPKRSHGSSSVQSPSLRGSESTRDRNC